MADFPPKVAFVFLLINQSDFSGPEKPGGDM